MLEACTCGVETGVANANGNGSMPHGRSDSLGILNVCVSGNDNLSSVRVKTRAKDIDDRPHRGTFRGETKYHVKTNVSGSRTCRKAWRMSSVVTIVRDGTSTTCVRGSETSRDNAYETFASHDQTHQQPSPCLLCHRSGLKVGSWVSGSAGAQFATGSPQSHLRVRSRRNVEFLARTGLQRFVLTCVLR